MAHHWPLLPRVCCAIDLLPAVRGTFSAAFCPMYCCSFSPERPPRGASARPCGRPPAFVFWLCGLPRLSAAAARPTSAVSRRSCDLFCAWQRMHGRVHVDLKRQAMMPWTCVSRAPALRVRCLAPSPVRVPLLVPFWCARACLFASFCMDLRVRCAATWKRTQNVTGPASRWRRPTSGPNPKKPNGGACLPAQQTLRPPLESTNTRGLSQKHPKQGAPSCRGACRKATQPGEASLGPGERAGRGGPVTHMSCVTCSDCHMQWLSHAERHSMQRTHVQGLTVLARPAAAAAAARLVSVSTGIDRAESSDCLLRKPSVSSAHDTPVAGRHQALAPRLPARANAGVVH